MKYCQTVNREELSHFTEYFTHDEILLNVISIAAGNTENSKIRLNKDSEINCN